MVRAAGAAVLMGAYAVAAVRWSRPPGARERAAFAQVNDGPERPLLRVPQQWGTPWTLPAVAVLALARRRPRHALVALACLPAVKGVEVATKKLRPRPRPLYVQPTVLRDDAPVEGGSMPSGHAAIATCGAIVLAPLVPRPLAAAGAAVTAGSAWTRVPPGAHEPLDAVGGLLLGGAVGLAATTLTGGPPTRP